MKAGIRDMTLTLVFVIAGIACLLIPFGQGASVDQALEGAASFSPERFKIPGYSTSVQSSIERDLFDYKGTPVVAMPVAAQNQSVFDGIYLEGLLKVGETTVAFIKTHGQRKVFKKGESVTSGVTVNEVNTDFAVLLHKSSGEKKRFYVNR